MAWMIAPFKIKLWQLKPSWKLTRLFHRWAETVIFSMDAFLHRRTHSMTLFIPRLCQRPSPLTHSMCIFLVSYPLHIFLCLFFVLSALSLSWRNLFSDILVQLNRWFSVHFSLCVIRFTVRLTYWNCRCFNTCMLHAHVQYICMTRPQHTWSQSTSPERLSH